MSNLLEYKDPSPEEILGELEIQREMMSGTTPTNCPYFQTSVVQQEGKNGVKVAYVDYLQIHYGRARHLVKQDNPTPIDRPDQIAIYPQEAGELYSIQMATTHFFVTQDGALCCLAGREKATFLEEHSLTVKEEMPGQDVWVLLEAEDSSPIRMRLREKMFFPYQEIRDAVKLRNEAWGIVPPESLLKIIANWQQPAKAIERAPRAPKMLPHPTFYEARTGATAISDGRDLRDWGMIDGMAAMLHAPKDSTMQTRFEPCSMLLGWWGKPTGAELETLKCELQNLEFDALVTYFVCLSWAIKDDRVATSLDSIIEAIGRGTDARRSTKNRQELRAKVWRWMLLFDSLAVIGARPGTWREPRDGDKKRERTDPAKLYSRDALLKIIGTRATEQGTFDNSAPPKEITFIAGDWVSQWRGNREMLSDFGNVRAIASIPRGKPSGAWAACVGFALNQKWREQASYAPVTRITKGDKKAITQKFRPFTRRALLAQLWRSDVDPEEILKGVNPERAKEYWDAAIEILKKEDVIGIYQEIKPLTVTGYGWQDAWLDQPLDIRPTGDTRKDAITIHKAATEAKKRTRKKPPKTPKTD